MGGNNASILASKNNGYELLVRTGDQKGKGTDSNVFVILTGRNGLKTPTIPLTNAFRDNFESGNTDAFPVNLQSSDGRPLGIVSEIEFWRDDSGFEAMNNWFCDLFILVDMNKGRLFYWYRG